VAVPYEEKFAEFIRQCKTVKEQGAITVIVTYPEKLGDTYEEMVESLSRVAELGLQLVVAEPSRSRRWGGPTGGKAR
jgi:hypothetical protein